VPDPPAAVLFVLVFALASLMVIIAGTVMIMIGLGLGVLVSKATRGSFQMIYSTTSMVAAFSCSTLIGVLFGY